MSLRRLVALTLALACAGCATKSVEDAKAPPAAQPEAIVAKPQPSPARASAKEPAPKDVPAPPPEPAPPKGEQLVAQGVKSYEDADYRSATNYFQAALHERLDPGDRASAHKYLAFIACTSNRASACRDEFRKAFVADPAFDLTPAEAGHPMWGPAFRRVKAEIATKSSKAKRAL